MRFSKKRINPHTRKELINNFVQVLADLRQAEEVKRFLEDFLTKAELLTLAKRLSIAFMLEKETPYQDIKDTLGVSSATIASVSDLMQKNPQGFKTALKRLEAEKWASGAAEKISHFFKGF
jgi:TrpR-related protein YerC/YecD